MGNVSIYLLQEGKIMITEENVMDALRQCFDPEIPMSIVDLGLIYDVAIKEGIVDIKMTLTTPGCGMAANISEDARGKVESIEGVKEVNIQIVWDPPWSPDRMNEEAKSRLGFA